MGSYVAGNLGVYKCPADIYLSPLQRLAGWSRRSRSMSMNAYFGPFNRSSVSVGNPFFPTYRQFLKASMVPNPVNFYVMLNEHPDSINDGYFLNDANPATLSYWGDLPASYHNGACGFGFSDGHSEIHKWRSRATIQPVRLSPGPQQVPFSVDGGGNMDRQWITYHTSLRK